MIGGLLKQDAQGSWHGETQAYLACLAALGTGGGPWEIRSDFESTCAAYGLQKASGKEVLHRRAHQEANERRLQAEQAHAPLPETKNAPVSLQEERVAAAGARLTHLGVLASALEKALAEIAAERTVLEGVISRGGLTRKEATARKATEAGVTKAQAETDRERLAKTGRPQQQQPS